MRRKQRRTLDLPKVAKLKVADCESVTWDHDLYTVFPIVSPAPCLAVKSNTDGMQEWQGMVVALPRDAPHAELISTPEIEAALALIKAVEKPCWGQLEDLEFIRMFFSRSFRDAPFWQGSLVALDHAFDAMKSSKIGVRRGNSILMDACESLLYPPEGAPSWSPLVLVSNVEVVSARRIDWTLLQHWREWTNQTRDLKELHAIFDKEVFEPLESERKMFGRRNRGHESSPERRHRFTAFRKRLTYLGLPASMEALRVMK